MRDNIMQFSADRNCNIGTTDIFDIAIKYEVNPNAGNYTRVTFKIFNSKWMVPSYTCISFQ